MGESYEFDAVEFITAGAVGEPGARTFYVQAVQGGQRVELVVEKGQVKSLAQLAQQMLAQAGTTVQPDDLDESAQKLREPLQPAWRAGAMSLGADEDYQRFLLEVEEATVEDEEPAVAQFWMGMEQLAALAAYAAYAVEAGARETCQLCGRPKEKDGHVCPSMNGHGPLPG